MKWACVGAGTCVFHSCCHWLSPSIMTKWLVSFVRVFWNYFFGVLVVFVLCFGFFFLSNVIVFLHVKKYTVQKDIKIIMHSLWTLLGAFQMTACLVLYSHWRPSHFCYVNPWHYCEGPFFMLFMSCLRSLQQALGPEYFLLNVL